MPPTREPEPLGFREALELLRHRRAWVVGVALVGAVVGVVAVTQVPQRYEAQAAVAFEKAPAAVEFREDPDRFYNDREQWMSTRREAMVSRAVLEQVLLRSSLRENPVYAASRDPVEALTKRIKATLVKNTLQIALTLQDEDPVRAENGLTTLIAEFFSDQARRTQARNAEDMAFLERQLTEARRRLQACLDDEQSFRDANQVLLTAGDRGPLVRLQEALAERRASLTERHAASASLMGLVRQAEVQSDGGNRREAYLRIDRIAQVPVVSALVVDLNALESREASLAVKYGDRHPRLIQARQELQAKREQLDRAIDTVRNGLDSESRQLDEQLAALDHGEAEARNNLAKARDAQARLDALHSATEAQSKTIAQMEAAIAQKRVTERMGDDRLQLVDPPRVSPEAVGWRKGPLALAAVMGSVLAGVAVGLSMELAIGRLRTSRAAAQRAGLEDLGTVLLGQPGALPAATDAPAVEESYRSLRTRLALGAASGSRIIVMASAIAGEGRSTVALRLAASHAAAGASTLVVEGDVHGASLLPRLGLAAAPGLTDLLTGHPDIAPQATSLPQLAIMGQGERVGNPGDILAGGVLAEWLGHLRQCVDIIIVDTPAEAEAADVLTWAAHADQVVVVCGPHTRGADVDRLMHTLAPCRARLAGVVAVQHDG